MSHPFSTNSIYVGVLEILSQKNHTKKISSIHKDFELYQLFMHNFLHQNVLMFPLYILLILEESTHFGLEVSG